MKIVIEIPKEFERDVKGKGCLGESNRFVEFFRRVLNDIRYGKCACGNYEEETAEMFADQFGKIQVLDDNHDDEILRQTIEKCAEIVSMEMHCINCTTGCHGFVPYEDCAETWKIYLTEQMKEVRNEKIL